ncbi:hypothetical protein [Helicobacter rodentium]|uniref:hypothetical protein n=1 Tax=Helicobacter rodentium TaxID=59617 RepID=UPI0023F3A67E|nr:hypothetical protein [Helicobacter rodentium]
MNCEKQKGVLYIENSTILSLNLVFLCYCEALAKAIHNPAHSRFSHLVIAFPLLSLRGVSRSNL